MSIRNLFEVNNDFAAREISRADLVNAAHDEGARRRLRHAGVYFLGSRHHADKGDADLQDWRPAPHPETSR